MAGMPAKSLSEEFIDCRPALVRYLARMLHSREDAEDVAQETYVRLARSEYEGAARSPKALIFRIARNLTLDSFRREQRHWHALESNGAGLADASEQYGPEDFLIGDEQLTVLLEALLHLPKRCRQVYTLRKVHGLSHRAIAERLGISVRTVENHIAKATKDCRNYVARHPNTAATHSSDARERS